MLGDLVGVREEGPVSPGGQTRSGPFAVLGYLRTARRLLVDFVAGAALVVAIGAVGLTRLAGGQRAVLAFDRDSAQAIAFLSGANLAFEQMRLEVADVAMRSPAPPHCRYGSSGRSRRGRPSCWTRGWAGS